MVVAPPFLKMRIFSYSKYSTSIARLLSVSADPVKLGLQLFTPIPINKNT